MDIVTSGTLMETWCCLGCLKAGWKEFWNSRLNSFDRARPHHPACIYASPPLAHSSPWSLYDPML
eukprot:1157360-Pelagomonas_calceolata.AAC.4